MSLKSVKENPDIVFPEMIPFLLFHLSSLAIFYTGVSIKSVIIGVVLLLVRMWGVTAGYHRYFSHKSFKTNRVFQFILAFIAQSSAQQGVLWWANHHRQHHAHSDTEHDVHSPHHYSFWYSHFGWVFSRKFIANDYTHVNDWKKYPELVWLDKHGYSAAILVGFLVWLFAGLQGLIVGFVLSTVVLYHLTFCINSLAHVYGKQRYITNDFSRNNWWLALLTLGEGWHNNHHHYASAARQGFRWYEIDITYYVLKGLEKLHVVRDLREPPEHVYAQSKTKVTSKTRDRITQSCSDIIDDIEGMIGSHQSLLDKPSMMTQYSFDSGKNICQQTRKYLINKISFYRKNHPPLIAQLITSHLKNTLSQLDQLYHKSEIHLAIDGTIDLLKQTVQSFHLEIQGLENKA